jgi:hypothetical protein
MCADGLKGPNKSAFTKWIFILEIVILVHEIIHKVHQKYRSYFQSWIMKMHMTYLTGNFFELMLK